MVGDMTSTASMSVTTRRPGFALGPTAFNAPVLHVNGDHPEGSYVSNPYLPSKFAQVSADVARAMEVAFKYRHFFRKDIIVDLIVYRRWYISRFFYYSFVNRSRSQGPQRTR